MTNYAQARVSNPSRYFNTPDHVLSDVKLSHADKVKILKSMAVDAGQKLEATSEGMAGSSPSYNAEDLQSALVHLENVKDVEGVETTNIQTVRFQRIMVVTTVDQNLNYEIAGVAFDMAESMGGKVSLLNVVPSAFDRAGLAAAGPMATAIPLVATDDAQIIEDRREQLEELKSGCGSSVETEIEVRSGQIEEVIVAYADEFDADLIVVGSPNRSWLEAFLDTSVARKVTRSAHCPVLVVPEPA
ncbi:universal stress protein [Pseudosulfitobacter pseudonitzschiae]|uniref:universal stress protein n=1 Tax=Pseudosulfitobacter pseudonitzschiae TaxID=1402135 RepID=UPI001AF8C13D|nr:universal stress protein [Pseudosulfitobacter pseudonitzschiae]MBM1818032.1 universal stress protein [Pseudosulfitobacter pseudonitzschiae]MBM1835059.1 universal stress protein [Pseudosulfitobacter pseudonitzschiae]MBM1839891.1 universal stress protein [Pseudosulfitobacter pseudonitzschiae]MBM1844774.1 universal stress protein [Pseudosulfitobacter pseudonitzschiae]MBM1849577.1 universal stress protein [Pseudosulfitobacter pseudonitzschiae]